MAAWTNPKTRPSGKRTGSPSSRPARYPKRQRRLLLHKREIDDLGNAVHAKGYTLLPLELYLKGGRVKVLLGLCKGKQLHDKRATERERVEKREIARELSSRRR